MVEKGSVVKMHYTLKVDGEVVDTSSGKEPMSFVQGSGQIIPGLEESLSGMKQGEKKNVVIQPEQGYGKKDPEAMQKVPKTAFKDLDKLSVGGMVSGSSGGQVFQAVVAEIGDNEVTLDFNHPLADKTLNFDVEIVEVNKPK